MKVKAYPHFLSAMIIVSLLFLGACSDPKFGVVRGQKQTSAPNLQTSSFQQCSNFTLIRPQVDLLFIWDNSSSSVFINDQTRESLKQVVSNISDRFDYHIVLAPLLKTGTNVNSNVKLVSFDTAGLNNEALSMRVAKNQASNNLSFPLGSGSREAGLERTRELLANNISNGIFRQGAYTIIVLMSTEDDTEYFNHFNITQPFSPYKQQYADLKINELLCLRGNHSGNCSGPTLNSSMMRFLSIVPRYSSTCTANGITNTKDGVSYEYASSKIYSAPYTNNIPQPNDQNGAPIIPRGSWTYPSYDSTDICQRNYSSIFDGVNSVIQDTVVNHVYNRWPVAGPNASVDPSSLVVRKSSGMEILPLGPGDTDGFTYIGSTNALRNTRVLPSPGEPYAGHMIQLHGNAQVTYPECLVVTSTTEREYFGYAHLGTGRPLLSSIELRINGSDLIPMCNSATTCTNGWVLETTYQENKNIKVTSPTNLSPANPPVLRTGYFLKLFGNAVYSSGDNVDVNWLPAGGN